MSRQCRGYANSLPIVAPYISGLSTTSSILGTTTIVTIFGENFRNFSTVYFGTTLINNVTYFSSGQLSFYVPAIATVGTYPIQVFNDTLGSNIVSFTINNSVGFWNQNGTGAITNNNASGGVNINGQLTVSGNETVNGQLTVSGNETVNGQLTVGGQIYNTATQPAPTNSSTIVPTTAWVQSAILYALTPVTTTYTSQNLNIPVLPNKRTCSINMIARGGTAGAILTNDGGTWRFGGAGGAGSGVIISNITIPINTAYFIFTNTGSGVSLSWFNGSTIQTISTCTNGGNGADASTSVTPAGGIGSTSVTNVASSVPGAVFTNFNGSNGSNGFNFTDTPPYPNGGQNLLNSLYGYGQNNLGADGYTSSGYQQFFSASIGGIYLQITWFY